MAIGRISGQLLKSNLLRAGEDLAFETDLLYLDVSPGRIGINTSTPVADLDVNGTVRSTSLVVDTQLDIANISITANNISSATNIISFLAAAGEATVFHSRLIVDDLQLEGNRISTEVSNSSIDIAPNGVGLIQLEANTNITGNLAVTGNVTAVGNVTIGGNIVIGDQITDTITINASIQSDLIPAADDTFDLGSPAARWRAAYVNDVFTTTINLPALNIGSITITGNEISTILGQDLILDGSGAGGVRLGNFRITDNRITNVIAGAVSIIEQTDIGYFKIQGTNGFVPPVGNTTQRPTAYAVVGMTRYNTVSKALEVWDGVAWASPAGAGGSVSENVANDIAAALALSLG